MSQRLAKANEAKEAKVKAMESEAADKESFSSGVLEKAEESIMSARHDLKDATRRGDELKAMNAKLGDVIASMSKQVA